ncbi:MAG: S-methyl-5-thioribose-1-phosphate isomerase [Candidatus Sumerlaeaceae bacterium]|jgi:methylthioribose-1-phosphate isomerase
MPKPTLWVENGRVFIIDQTKLPLEYAVEEILSVEQMWSAIRTLRVRGAPAIGIAAALGVWVAIRDQQSATSKELVSSVERACGYLGTARPTAVNLFWALERVKTHARKSCSLPPNEFKREMLALAEKMIEEDNEVCLALGRYGASLLSSGDRVLTHCNAGGLATAQYGTALAAVYYAVEREGKTIEVFADETRPLLQGARLTAWELREAGIPVTLICDNMAADIMRRAWVNAVFVGTDRTVRNGDVANKIGTYGLAVLAKQHGIPFYVVAPLSSIDISLASGDQIPIEQRPAEEVTTIAGRRIAPEGINVYNPAFDVTPHELITAIITEKGIVHPPYAKTIPDLFTSK